MKKFSVDLIEDNFFHDFTYDSYNRKEYIFKKKTGILKREYNESWLSSSFELNSINDAKAYISKGFKSSSFKNFKTNNIEFSPGKVLRDNEFILNFLRSLDLKEWKIVFRVKALNRLIINNKNKGLRNGFTHYSIIIKLKLNNCRNYIEIGEGSTGSFKFNQTGLSLRIKDVINNHNNKIKNDFKDRIPVILNSGDGGIIFHEILGHSLEVDYIYQKLSPISIYDVGHQIISKNVNLVADYEGDMFFSNRMCDDEGVSSKSSMLVENGILRNFISDIYYKNLLNIKNSGYSRVEDFSKVPMPRMFAIYLKPGPYNAQELIESTKYGIYAKEFGEGKTYFNKNSFFFNIKEAYLIENGKLTSPLGDVIVKGNIMETLNSVDMVADDFRYDKGISYCFKNGQTLNVRVGQPTVKINNLFVKSGLND